MEEKLHKKLRERREKGTIRSLSSSDGMLDFASNDYLGFAHDGVGEIATLETGSTGSRLISGNSTSAEKAEKKLADFFESEAALCFNSGYDANLAIFSSIPQRGDVVLYDEFIHASARDGVRLSHAKAYSFKHNDCVDLRRLLEANKHSCVYIGIESLYSMHGDFSPLKDIVTLSKEFGAYILLDEAHSAGIYGKDGRGFAHALQFHEDIFLRLVTFGKAFGGHGAAVLSSSDLREYLINFARPFIYSTALPANVYERMGSVILTSDAVKKRQTLQDNLRYFREKSMRFETQSEPNSPIQFLRFAHVELLKRIETRLKDEGIFVKAIYPPTVAEGHEGLRISLHSFNLRSEIDKLVDVICSENDTFGKY